MNEYAPPTQSGWAREAPFTIGRYELCECFAHGGTARVYIGRLIGVAGFRRLVAIKRLRESELELHGVVELFLEEARLAARISHPNVVPIIDVQVDGGEVFLVQEYVHGLSLSRLMKAAAGRFAIPPGVAVAILLDVLHGLQAVHDATGDDGRPLQIVHRDVSPQNIVLGADGVARVVDFGIAKATSGPMTTETGVIKGKLGYLAPEQVDGAPVTPAVDTFAAGIVLWELLTSRPLLSGGTLQEHVRQLVRGRFRPPSDYQVGVSASLDAVVMRALSIKPEDRHASARSLAAALECAVRPAPRSDVVRWLATHVPDALAQSARRMAAALSLGAEDGDQRGIDELTTRLSGPPGALRAAAASSAALSSRRRTWPLAAASGAGLAASMLVAWTTLTGPTPPIVMIAAPLGHAEARAAKGPVSAPPCPAGMVYVRGGRFVMGKNDPDSKAYPAHPVELTGFCLDRYEATVAEYVRCTRRGQCIAPGTTNNFSGVAPAGRRVLDPLCNARGWQSKLDQPINCVDHEQSRTFCAALGKRLPTEAEWEYAARGDSGRVYPWGNHPPSPIYLNGCGSECVAWGRKNRIPLTPAYAGNDGFETTAPGGFFGLGASLFGVEDMAGNVWEWVSDFYAPYGGALERDPRGPQLGTLRVIRGGAWNSSTTSWQEMSFRLPADGSARSYAIGFRCALDR